MNTDRPLIKNDMTFTEFARDFHSTIGIVGKLILIIPLSDLITHIGPAWPSRAGIGLLGAFIQLIALIFAFEFWFEGGSVKVNRKVMKWCLAILIVSGSTYLIAFSLWNVAIDGHFYRVIIGYEFLNEKEAERCAEPGAPNCTPYDLLINYKGKPDLIWTPISLTVTRMVSLASWFLAWFMFSILVATFICTKWRRQRARQQREAANRTET